MIVTESRLGEIVLNTKGTPMKIIKYNACNDVIVEFQDEHKVQVNTTYNNFRKRCISNPYDKTVYKVGYIGFGEYKTKVSGKNTIVFDTWYNMLRRCYGEEERQLHLTYKDCSVIDEWHNLQNFAVWYDENFYDVGDGTRMHIDKDVLVKGNKIYSPDTCIFLPQRINVIFTSKSRVKDQDLPNSIYRCKNGFKAFFNGKSLGIYKTVDDAAKAHDDAIRLHIKQVVFEYGNKLPEKIRNALLSW